LIASVAEARRLPVATHPEDERAQAAATLRRLVTFTASALDVRFAFVVAFGDAHHPAEAPAAVWLGKDFGLRSIRAEIAWSDPTGALEEIAPVLRAAFPQEAALGRIGAGTTTSLALRDDDARLIGHLGIADPGRVCALAAREHLHTLLRPAVAEVGRWAALR
jgi:hypothetical protein